jgi:hypothetical protein
MTETSPEPIDDGSAGTPTPRHFYRLLAVSGTIMWLRRRPTRVFRSATDARELSRLENCRSNHHRHGIAVSVSRVRKEK